MWSVQGIREQQSLNSLKRAGGLWEFIDLSFRENDRARHSDDKFGSMVGFNERWVLMEWKRDQVLIYICPCDGAGLIFCFYWPTLSLITLFFSLLYVLCAFSAPSRFYLIMFSSLTSSYN